MADIFQEVEEDLRRDRYQRLAKKYGGYLVAGMLLLVLGTTGYVLWKNWHETRERAATLQLAEAVDQVAQAGATAGQAAPAPALPPEFNGPKGPEPIRYGDWERKGIASDF